MVVVTPDLASVRGANRVIDLCKRFGGLRAADAVHLELQRGEFRAARASAGNPRGIVRGLYDPDRKKILA